MPKTGCSSVARALKRYSDLEYANTNSLRRHMKSSSVRRAIGEAEWSRYFTFGFVRNPWDKMVSSFFFYKNGRVSKRIKNRKTVKLRYRLAHLLSCLLPFRAWELFYSGTPCTDFLCDEEDNLLVDYVGRFETLEQDLKYVFTRIGLEWLNLPHVNASRHKSYRTYYGPITRRVIQNRFQSDIDRFGYSF